MSFYKTEPPDTDLDGDPDFNSEHRYPCACGNSQCIADDRDEGNYQIRGEWYSADCEVAKYHPDVIGDVLAQLHQDELQDEFNERRR